MFQEGGIEKFRAHEITNAGIPHDAGPLRDFLANVNRIQQREEQECRKNPDYRIRLHVSIVTARNAPAHERAVQSLKGWGVTVNDAFFLGGIDKGRIMKILKPHIFFDDQQGHLESTSRTTPSVHVPFGKLNEPVEPAGPDA